MNEVPRHNFVPEPSCQSAYDDAPLGIGQAQTISQPYLVRMVEPADARPGRRVLEIGSGSGYAAAVLASIAAHVVTVERLAALAQRADATLAALGNDQCRVHIGDGTLGWAAAAPYDTIIASAGGPDIPQAWVDQPSPGRSLLMPLGNTRTRQTLTHITRDADGHVTREALDDVHFVPLIGEQGWEDSRAARMSPVARLFPDAALPIPALDDPAFAEWIDRFADCRVLLLGESTHGTTEFYRASPFVTQRLVERHGLTIIAVEADWPDAAAIDWYVGQRPPVPGTAPDAPFSRFPT